MEETCDLRALKAQFTKGGPGACPSEKFWDLGLLKYISSIVERKLECLNRTQTSLISGFGWGGGGGVILKEK